MTPPDHDVLRLRNHPAGLVARLCVLGALGLIPLSTAASTYPNKMRADGQRIMNSVLGSNSKLSVAGSGQPVSASPLAGHVVAGASSPIGIAADGASLKYGSRALVPLEAGRTLAVDVAGGISKASLAKAGRAFLGGPLGVLLIAGSIAAPHISDWMEDAGLTVEGGQIKKPAEGAGCATTDTTCYRFKYWLESPPGTWTEPFTAWHSTPQAACGAIPPFTGGLGTFSARWESGVCRYRRVTDDVPMSPDISGETASGSSVGSPAGSTPATPQQIEDALMEANAPPGVVRELLDSGQELDIEAPTVTGPASTPGPSKQINRPDGKIETQTTTHNHTYEGDTVTTTITNVTNIYNPETNTTETTTEEREPEDERQCKDGDQTLGCAEFGEPPEDEIPKSTFDITFVPENLFGAGTCPTWPSWTDALGTHTLDFTGYCTLASTVIRPLLLAFALLAAIFIVAPVGGKD